MDDSVVVKERRHHHPAGRLRRHGDDRTVLMVPGVVADSLRLDVLVRLAPKRPRMRRVIRPDAVRDRARQDMLIAIVRQVVARKGQRRLRRSGDRLAVQRPGIGERRAFGIGRGHRELLRPAGARQAHPRQGGERRGEHRRTVRVLRDRQGELRRLGVQLVVGDRDDKVIGSGPHAPPDELSRRIKRKTRRQR